MNPREHPQVVEALNRVYEAKWAQEVADDYEYPDSQPDPRAELAHAVREAEAALLAAVIEALAEGDGLDFEAMYRKRLEQEGVPAAEVDYLVGLNRKIPCILLTPETREALDQQHWAKVGALREQNALYRMEADDLRAEVARLREQLARSARPI